MPEAEEKKTSADKDEKSQDERFEKALALIEKSAGQTATANAELTKARQENAILKARLARLEKALTPPKDTKPADLPKPKDMTGDPSNHQSSDGSTKASKETTSTEGAMTSEKVAKAIADGLAASREQIKKELQEELTASTPTPWGMSAAPAMMKARKDLPGLIAEVIAKDREYCGAQYSAEDSFGFPAGTGDDIARERMAKYLNEQFGGAL